MSTAIRIRQSAQRPSDSKDVVHPSFASDSAALSGTSSFTDTHEERIEIIFDGIQFFYYKSPVLSPGLVRCDLTADTISFVFFAAGSGNLSARHEVKAPICFKERQQSILFVSSPGLSISTNSGKKAEVFVINLSRSYFSTLLRNDHPLHLSLQEYSGNDKIKQAVINSRVTPRMVALLYSMLQSEHQGEYNHLFFQARVMELLILQLEQLEKDHDSSSTISSEDKQRMLRAKEVIESNLSSPCSIIDLAQLVGTNDCYLKKHFKQAFGTTVYGYLQQKRMEKAKALLLEGKKKMTDIARSVGYKHASHFSTAFKKHFGYQPNKIRVLIASFLFESDMFAAFL
jgi:AraC-like DNA-binding protein